MKNLRFPNLSLGLARLSFLVQFLAAIVLSVVVANEFGLVLGFIALTAVASIGFAPSVRLGPYDNTVAAELTRAKIMDVVLEAFVAEILPLRAFSMKILPEAQTLNEVGTADVYVPFIPIQTNAVKDFDAAAGDCYEGGTTTTEKRRVTIDKRKYLPWNLTSHQAATTPILMDIDFARIFGRMLAQEVIADILGNFTAANYPNEIPVGTSANFDTDDVFDIRKALNGLKFPKIGRSLILTEDYDTELLKDNKDTNIYGSTDPRWNARIPRIAGMDEYGTAALDDLDDVDAGLVALPQALAVAMAPLEPLPKIREFLSAFEIYTHEESGISLVYKEIADPKCDSLLKLVECTYGDDPLQEEAAVRLVIS
jgi:hypothetical protein